MKHFLCIFLFVNTFLTSLKAQTTLSDLHLTYVNCTESDNIDCFSNLLGALKNLPQDSSSVVSIMELGNEFSGKKSVTQAKEIYDIAMSKAKDNGDNALISSVYQKYGSLALYTGDVEGGLNNFQKSFELAEQTGQKLLINKAKLNLGTAYRTKGDIDKAAANFHEAVIGFESLGLVNEVGYPYMNLGILYGMHRQYEKSIDNFRKARGYFLRSNDTLMLANISVNLANSFMSARQLDSAEVYLQVAIETFERDGDIRSIINTESQLGRLYLYQSKWEKAENVVLSATRRAKEQNFIPQAMYNNRLLSELYIEQKQYDKALEAIEESLDMGTGPNINNEYIRCLDQMARIHEYSNNFKYAYIYEKEARRLDDSLFTAAKKLKIEELEAKFESEKKEKEIAKLNVLNANAKMAKLNLRWGILLLALSSFLTVGFLIFKNKKQKIILSKERDVEIVNRKNIELENTVLQNNLELKNKELVSSALLISKKKSFLQSLKEVITSKGDKAINLIDRELESESEWKSFIDVFNQTHDAFIERLNHKHPNLTSNDVRLVCLIKMNLSSKEIASMINISYEGIKKAKYRLKKKLNLDESVDMNEYILQDLR